MDPIKRLIYDSLMYSGYALSMSQLPDGEWLVKFVHIGGSSVWGRDTDVSRGFFTAYSMICEFSC